MSPNNPAKQPWYKNYLLVVFVIGLPAFVVVACLFFIVFAVKIKDTTVRDDWYMDGKTLYQDASKDQLAYDLALHGVMRFHDDKVVFELGQDSRRAKADFKPPATLNAKISHATDKNKDRDFTLSRGTDGHYHGTTTIDALSAKYYLHVQDEQEQWRLVHSQKLPAQNVVFNPLASFEQSDQPLPDQRHKRHQQNTQP